MSLSAVIDLGTNTLRLLLAEVSENGLIPIYSENRMTRLGEGFSEERRFRTGAMERTMAVLTSFKAILRSYAFDRLYVIGTSAFREATNRDGFLLSIKEKLGWNVEVITGEEEGRLAFLGAHVILKSRARPMLLIDIGGGSTEFVVAQGETPSLFLTTGLGVVRLTERYLHSDPPTGEECDALQLEIHKVLRGLVLKFPENLFFAGVAGTFTTLAAIDQKMTCYDPEKINGYPLSKKGVEAILEKLLSLPLKERCRVAGLEKGREDLIIPGMFILLTLMELCGVDSVTVSDYGLREGVLIDRYRKEICEKGNRPQEKR